MEAQDKELSLSAPWFAEAKARKVVFTTTGGETGLLKVVPARTKIME